MKNKPLSPYKKQKLIEAFCDELTATQAAHRLKLDRNTINKYYKRIREHIAAYREYHKMRLLVNAIGQQGRQVEIASLQIPSMSRPGGFDVKVMWIGGQLLTEPGVDPPKGLPSYKVHMPDTEADELDPVVLTQTEQPLKKVVDEFQSFACGRLKRYYGIRGSFAYLYIKEAEFVFNEKDVRERYRVLKSMKI